MKLLFCGDIVGRSGREAVTKNVPRLREQLGLDFVVVNGENAAAGFGITAKICAELHEAGVDCITAATMSGTSARSCHTSRRTSGCCARSTIRRARPAGAPTCSRRRAVKRSLW